MGFLDKVKEQAAKAGEGIKKGTASVKDKVEDAQLQKKADENAKQIGYLVVKEKAEGTAPPAGEVDRLVQEIVALQQQIAEVPAALQQAQDGAVQAESAPATPAEQAASAPASVPPPPTSASETTEGDFKLD
jgi:seryl-tRNA synthetase